MGTDTDHRTSEGELSANVASCVVRVANLDRSVRFYCDVFSCHVVSRGADMALLLIPKGFQIYPHEVSGCQHRGAVGIHSVQYVMWATDSQSELTHMTRASARLRHRSVCTQRRRTGDH
jgi:catechol 2,3-dioxygenase-like lactoylglutathione lyase family enzyme